MTTTLEYQMTPQERNHRKNMSADAAERRMRSSELTSDRESDAGVAVIPPNNRHPIRDAAKRTAHKSRPAMPYQTGRNTMKNGPPKPSFQPMVAENFYNSSSKAESSTNRASRTQAARQSQPQSISYNSRDKGKGKAVVEHIDEEEEEEEEEPVEASPRSKRKWQKAHEAKAETAEDIQSFSDVEREGLSVVSPPGFKRKRSKLQDRNGNIPPDQKASSEDKTAIFRPGSKTATLSSALPLAVDEAYLDGCRFPIATLTISPQNHILCTLKTGARWKESVDQLALKLPVATAANPGHIFALTLSGAQARRLAETQNEGYSINVGNVDLWIKLDSKSHDSKTAFAQLRLKENKSIQFLEPQVLDALFPKESTRELLESSPDPLAMSAPRSKQTSKIARMQPKLPKDTDDVQLMDKPPMPPSRVLARSGTRRSARRSGASAAEPEDVDGGFQLMPKPSARCLDPDKLLFKYPIDGRGGISITDGDRDRMRNEEYLNDTLIEFGLKLIFAELSEVEKNRIHIFNSFFYKKLSINRTAKRRRSSTGEADVVAPDHWEGYEAVKKWTVKSKVDIFDKDLVIVPINEHLHWYLAVIYNPKGILKEAPAPSPPPSPPRRTRAQVAEVLDTERTLPEVLPPADSSALKGMVNWIQGALGLKVDQPAPSHDELSISPEREQREEPEMPCGQSESTVVVNKMEEMQIESTTIDSDEDDDKPEPLNTRTTQRNARGKAGSLSPSILWEEPVLPPKRPKKVIERKKIWGHEGSWILVFDSLGSNHPAVGRNLRKWLEYEARERRGVTYPMTTAEHFDVKSGLTQPNGWDCGVYALYTAERIMKHPEQVISFSEKPQPLVSADREWYNERKRVWSDDDVRTKRQEWTMRIDSLTEQYAEEMTAKSRSEGVDPPTALPAPVPVEGSILPDDEHVDSLQTDSALDPALDPPDSHTATVASMSDSDVDAAVATTTPSRQSKLRFTPPPKAKVAPGQDVIQKSQRVHARMRRRCIDQSRADKVEEESGDSPDPAIPIPSMGLDQNRFLVEGDDEGSQDLPGQDVTIAWSLSPGRAVSESLSKSEEKEEIEKPSSRAGSAIAPDLTAPAQFPRPSCSPTPRLAKRGRGASAGPPTAPAVQERKAGSKHTKVHITKHAKKKGGTADEPVLIEDSDDE